MKKGPGLCAETSEKFLRRGKTQKIEGLTNQTAWQLCPSIKYPRSQPRQRPYNQQVLSVCATGVPSRNLKTRHAVLGDMGHAVSSTSRKFSRINMGRYYSRLLSRLEGQGGHHEVLDNIKIKHVSTTRYILSPRQYIPC